MQAPPPQPMHLHWIPVEPSWIVSLGLVVLAVLPHQIPVAGRRVLKNWIGSIAFATGAAWVFTRVPPLGIAMVMLLFGIHMSGDVEGFAAPILNKDPVTKQQKKRWLPEEVFSEDPHGIQDRTEGPELRYDAVDHDKDHWFVEDTLNEHPEAIQERPVSDDIDYDGAVH